MKTQQNLLRLPHISHIAIITNQQSNFKKPGMHWTVAYTPDVKITQVIHLLLAACLQKWTTIFQS